MTFKTESKRHWLTIKAWSKESYTTIADVTNQLVEKQEGTEQDRQDLLDHVQTYAYEMSNGYIDYIVDYE